MLDDSEPSQGTADHVWSGNKNRLAHYEGHAVVWQTGNRVEADRIDIDRDKKILVATGNVVSEFIDQDNNKDKPPPLGQPQMSTSAAPVAAKPQAPDGGLGSIPPASSAAPAPKTSEKPVVYTVVHAAKLVYTDETRLADYTGSVVATRPNMTIKGDQMQAFLNPRDSSDDSRLNHMLADGNVEIFDKAVDRTRTSKGDHGEYYTADSRIVIRGNNATMVDSKRGDIVGLELIYYSDDDRLQVKRPPEQPVKSRLHRKQ